MPGFTPMVVFGDNTSISAFNSLLSVRLPLCNQLRSSGFISLSSSIMGLHKVLPIIQSELLSAWMLILPLFLEKNMVLCFVCPYQNLSSSSFCVLQNVLFRELWKNQLYECNMQELIRIKENNFCVIRALSGKFMLIRLHFHFLNAETIISNATLNIFSSYLLSCTSSTLSQFISPEKQAGSSLIAGSQVGRRMLKAPLCGKRGHKMFVVQVFIRKSRFWIIINNYDYVVLLRNFKIIQRIFLYVLPQTPQWSDCRR